MLKRHVNTAWTVVFVADAAIIIVAWFFSYWASLYFAFVRIPPGMRDFRAHSSLAPFITILWLAVFSWMNVYNTKKTASLCQELFTITRAYSVAFLLFIASTVIFDQFDYPRIVIISFAISGLICIVLFRILLRELLRRVRGGRGEARSVLAIGEGAGLESVLHRLGSFPQMGGTVCGVVTHETSETEAICDLPVLGHFDRLPYILQSHHVDEVYICLPPSQYHELDRVLRAVSDETIDVRLVLDLHQYVTLSCEAEEIDGIPIVCLNDSPIFGWRAVAKRVTDIAVSGIVLFIFFPLLLVIGILIKLTSPGPMFYGQERMGYDGRTFKMLKFRTMKADAEAASGPVWAQAVDDRRTTFGTFLRKTSLDELPQLWNVLRGDMSLVGPRPERPVFVEQFRTEIPLYMLRHKVKAGITGWAQVNGWRGNTSLHRRIEHDLFYIRHWSYGLDIKILFFTLWKGFIHENAY